MKVFLAATYTREEALKDKPIKYMLESFYYVKPWQIERIKSLDMFLLDSGAFTFMSGTSKPDLESYLQKYIEFINKHDIQYFFELDCDSIVGYEQVKEWRQKLENETGKRCIPVWHKSRGQQEFIEMCDQYDYVAIGGIVAREITRSQYPALKWFIKEAHKRGCKIHGLGFTNVNMLPEYHFDSVDSTSWLSGTRYGHVYQFTGNTIKTIAPPKGKKTANYKKVDDRNVDEWMKFVKYADTHL